jgi:hypothetical protein
MGKYVSFSMNCSFEMLWGLKNLVEGDVISVLSGKIWFSICCWISDKLSDTLFDTLSEKLTGKLTDKLSDKLVD